LTTLLYDTIDPVNQKDTGLRKEFLFQLLCLKPNQTDTSTSPFKFQRIILWTERVWIVVDCCCCWWRFFLLTGHEMRARLSLHTNARVSIIRGCVGAGVNTRCVHESTRQQQQTVHTHTHHDRTRFYRMRTRKCAVELVSIGRRDENF
jgi:hypothetical protein